MAYRRKKLLETDSKNRRPRAERRWLPREGEREWLVANWLGNRCRSWNSIPRSGLLCRLIRIRLHRCVKYRSTAARMGSTSADFHSFVRLIEPVIVPHWRFVLCRRLSHSADPYLPKRPVLRKRFKKKKEMLK